MYHRCPLALLILVFCLGGVAVSPAFAFAVGGVLHHPAISAGRLLALSTSRVSVWSTGGEGDGAATMADISASGRWVVFQSVAGNGEPAGNGLTQVYLHDRAVGQTTLISVTPKGFPGMGTSERPTISDDGTVIAFRSGASDLVEADNNGYFDILVYDRQRGHLERISERGDGSEAQRDAAAPALSAEGRYVVFESQDSLLPIDRNGVRDVYRKDRQNGTLELVSMIYTGGAAGTGASREPAISQDGRYIAFISAANNLVPNDQGAGYQTYLRDMNTGTTIRLSVGVGGTDPVGGDCATPTISADARHVAFSCAATNLVANDTNGVADIFIAAVNTTTPPTLGIVTRLAATTDDAEPNGDSTFPFYAPDSAALAFTSAATNFVAEDTNGVTDVFLWRNDGVERYSVATDGSQATDASVSSGIAKAYALIFRSEASNLVANDSNGVSDVFVRGEPLQVATLYLPLTQRH